MHEIKNFLTALKIALNTSKEIIKHSNKGRMQALAHMVVINKQGKTAFIVSSLGFQTNVDALKCMQELVSQSIERQTGDIKS